MLVSARQLLASLVSFNLVRQNAGLRRVRTTKQRMKQARLSKLRRVPGQSQSPRQKVQLLLTRQNRA